MNLKHVTRIDGKEVEIVAVTRCFTQLADNRAITDGGRYLIYNGTPNHERLFRLDGELFTQSYFSKRENQQINQGEKNHG